VDVGLGRGLTESTDKWVFETIIGFEFK